MKKKIVLERAGITIAVSDPVTIADDGYGDFGMGVRKHGDRFSAVTGAKMALKSLLNRHYNHNKPYRELAWEEFFAHPWVVKQKQLEAERENKNKASAAEIIAGARFYRNFLGLLAIERLSKKRLAAPKGGPATFQGIDQAITAEKPDHNKYHEI